jgi:hypothetical protein
MNNLWGRVSGNELVITKGRSPIAEVVEVIKCGSRSSAEKALDRFLKETGKTFGGRQ